MKENSKIVIVGNQILHFMLWKVIRPVTMYIFKKIYFKELLHYISACRKNIWWHYFKGLECDTLCCEVVWVRCRNVLTVEMSGQTMYCCWRASQLLGIGQVNHPPCCTLVHKWLAHIKLHNQKGNKIFQTQLSLFNQKFMLHYVLIFDNCHNQNK